MALSDSRIVFDHDGARQTGDHVTNEHAVRGEFFIAVIGYTCLAARDERSHPLQGLAQLLDPFLLLIMRASVRRVPLTTLGVDRSNAFAV